MLRIHEKLIWFSVLGWVLFLIICFHKNSDFGINHANSPEQSDPLQRINIVIRNSQKHHTPQSNGKIPVQWKGHNRNKAGEQNKSRKRRKYIKTMQKTLPEDWLEFFSSGKTVVHALWNGKVSSRMLSIRLQKSKKFYVDKNDYNVTYRPLQKKQLENQELLCQLKQHAQVRTLDGTEEPFANQEWRDLVPSQPLESLHGTPFRTCAVVSSAASIINSSLGEEIDSHDAVLRFNAAPTQNYQRDVGNKTTIRIINSQVLAKPQHKFNTSSLYKNITLVAWDPASYSADLHKWYKRPDYDLFSKYMEHRRRSPTQLFYILHPTFVWSLWTMLQTNTDENIQPNPPSSGYLGIALMMNLCESVDVYEFIPSKRHTTLCHYYEPLHDIACTLGAYHPLLFEKLLVRKMSTASVQEISEKGKVTLPGFSKITCPP